MPYIVQEIVEENPDLVTAKADERVRDALARMIEQDFSQLPIVDEDNRPTGMITSESILRALSNFDAGLDDLLVGHTRVKADLFRDDSDLFELLDRLRDTYAVLIVDGAGCLKGIVTNYDTAEYFRRRAEDMMLVEDVETLLKDYIQAAYKNGEDEVDEAKLTEAIQRITSGRNKQRETFKQALWNYLNLQYGNDHKLNQELLERVLEAHYKIEVQSKQFDDLTLDEYITLLLHKESWDHYYTVFNLDRNAIRNLLHKVRDTRNALAHFRGEISLAQRKTLRFAADWFAQYVDMPNGAFAIEATQPEVATRETSPQAYYTVEEEEPSEEIVPAEDEADPGESRYAPLAIWLQNQHPRKDLVKPTFSKIEEIIGGKLPESAYNHRAWWANDSASHVQSQQWLDVGWRVSSINMTNQVVSFSRIRDRHKAYIDFYSSLLTSLRKQPGFKNISVAPNGANWHLIEFISVNGKGLASLTLAFGRGNKFRIELYIDSGDQALNKRLYDRLEERREQIEQALEQELLWQRLDKRRASRIAVVFENVRVISLPSELNTLQTMAVPSIVKFREVMLPQVQELGKEVVYALARGG